MFQQPTLDDLPDTAEGPQFLAARQNNSPRKTPLRPLHRQGIAGDRLDLLFPGPNYGVGFVSRRKEKIVWLRSKSNKRDKETYCVRPACIAEKV